MLTEPNSNWTECFRFSSIWTDSRFRFQSRLLPLFTTQPRWPRPPLSTNGPTTTTHVNQGIDRDLPYRQWLFSSAANEPRTQNFFPTVHFAVDEYLFGFRCGNDQWCGEERRPNFGISDSTQFFDSIHHYFLDPIFFIKSNVLFPQKKKKKEVSGFGMVGLMCCFH